MQMASAGQRESPVTPSNRSLTPRPSMEAVSPGASVKRASMDTVGPVGDSSHAVAARRQKKSAASRMAPLGAEVMPAAGPPERGRFLELEPNRKLVVCVDEAVPEVRANGPAAAQADANARADIDVVATARLQPSRHPGRIDEHRDADAKVLAQAGEATGVGGLGTRIGRIGGLREAEPVLPFARAVHDGAAHLGGPEIAAVQHEAVGAQRDWTWTRVAAVAREPRLDRQCVAGDAAAGARHEHEAFLPVRRAVLGDRLGAAELGLAQPRVYVETDRDAVVERRGKGHRTHRGTRAEVQPAIGSTAHGHLKAAAEPIAPRRATRGALGGLDERRIERLALPVAVHAPDAAPRGRGRERHPEART